MMQVYNSVFAWTMFWQHLQLLSFGILVVATTAAAMPTCMAWIWVHMMLVLLGCDSLSAGGLAPLTMIQGSFSVAAHIV